MSTTSTDVAFGTQPVDRFARERVAMVVLADHEDGRLGCEHEIGVVALGEHDERVGRELLAAGDSGSARSSANGPHGATPTAMFAMVSMRTTEHGPRATAHPLAGRVRHVERGDRAGELQLRARLRRSRSRGSRSPRGRPPAARPGRARDRTPRLTRAGSSRPRADRVEDRAPRSPRAAHPCSRFRCTAGRSRRRARARPPPGCRRSPLAPFMSSASLTITPSKPSSSRSRPWRTRGAQRRRVLRVDLRQQDVRGHDRARAGLDRRPRTASARARAARRGSRRRPAAPGASPARCRRGRGSAWR